MGLLAQKLTPNKWTTAQLDQLSSNVVQRVCSVSSPRRIIWFGSSFRNEMNGLSDFDFAILFSDKESLKKGKKSILTKQLFTDINVDLLFYTTEEFNKKSHIGGICWEIHHSGKVIYDQRAEI